MEFNMSGSGSVVLTKVLKCPADNSKNHANMNLK